MDTSTVSISTVSISAAKQSKGKKDIVFILSISVAIIAIGFAIYGFIRSLTSDRVGLVGEPGDVGDRGEQGIKGKTGPNGRNTAALTNRIGFVNDRLQPVNNIYNTRDYIPLYTGFQISYFTGTGIASPVEVIQSISYQQGNPDDIGPTKSSEAYLTFLSLSPQTAAIATGRNTWTKNSI